MEPLEGIDASEMESFGDGCLSRPEGATQGHHQSGGGSDR